MGLSSQVSNTNNQQAQEAPATQQSENNGNKIPSNLEEPVLYTGSSVPKVSYDTIDLVSNCIADCSSDCGMFSVNSVFFDGVLDINFSCIENCMDGKQTLCSNVQSCQTKC